MEIGKRSTPKGQAKALEILHGLTDWSLLGLEQQLGGTTGALLVSFRPTKVPFTLLRLTREG